jgi:predicted helicase
MAALARRIRDTVQEVLLDEAEASALRRQMDALRAALQHDLPAAQFADAYAQTVCLGLLSARCSLRSDGCFTRESAARALPHTSPLLRSLFHLLAAPDLDVRLARVVDALADLLDRADVGAVLGESGRGDGREDPALHFYERFLAAYDPGLRRKRGVYYTPGAVVSYLVRSVDGLLKTGFGLPDGLADRGMAPVNDGTAEAHRVRILDPATGTGAFLQGVVERIYRHERAENRESAWPGYVSAHLLPRLLGFELLPASYAVAHLNLGLQLARTGCDFNGEGLPLYLANALEAWEGLPSRQLSERPRTAAGAVAEDLPILVVLGNPPYSGHSLNAGPWIDGLLRGEDSQTGAAAASYFMADGKPLGERNPKWLHNDYVKFIRFAQWHIERSGRGILAFVTDHSYLDNPTFRGMRESLLETFDEIYILDLHGNSRKKERAPDGSRDENVFTIQQGVAIGIFVRRGGRPGKAAVRHAHLWGTREEKSGWLDDRELASTPWREVTPRSPFYLFVPQDTDLRAEYEQGWAVGEALPLHALGFQTHRDHFAVDLDPARLRGRVAALRDAARTDEELRAAYGLRDNRDWRLESARRVVRADPEWERPVIRCLYRPFDWRSCYFSPAAMDYPRRELMDHVAGKENLCLCLGRQGLAVNDPQWSLVAASREPVDANLFRRGGATVFPLYLYGRDAPEGRRPNLAPAFLSDFSRRLRMEFVLEGRGDRERTFGPEDVFHYLYALLHSPVYRRRYADFLKIDFPRLPLTRNPALFRALCTLGEGLVGLHLMEKPLPPLTRNPADGDHRVTSVRYVEKDRRVWINASHSFKGAPPEVWELRIGGYQVCKKWLKDRQGCVLSDEDWAGYQRLVAVLGETLRRMAEIDAAIEGAGGWPIQSP